MPQRAACMNCCRPILADAQLSQTEINRNSKSSEIIRRSSATWAAKIDVTVRGCARIDFTHKERKAILAYCEINFRSLRKLKSMQTVN